MSMLCVFLAFKNEKKPTTQKGLLKESREPNKAKKTKYEKYQRRMCYQLVNSDKLDLGREKNECQAIQAHNVQYFHCCVRRINAFVDVGKTNNKKPDDQGHACGWQKMPAPVIVDDLKADAHAKTHPRLHRNVKLKIFGWWVANMSQGTCHDTQHQDVGHLIQDKYIIVFFYSMCVWGL